MIIIHPSALVMGLKKFKTGILFLVIISVFVQASYAEKRSPTIAAPKKNKKQHPHGKHTAVVSFDGNNGVIIDQDSIKMLTKYGVGDRKIVIFSIVGEFRKGKSFFMDYALRFMYSNVS